VKRLAYIGPAILIVYALLRSIDVVSRAYLMDPHYFWLGSRILAQGGDPYDAATWDAAVRASFAQFGAALPPPWPAEFRYPLWTAIAVLPLAALSLQAATAVWQLLLITGTVAGATLALRASGSPTRTLPLFLTLVLASQPFLFTVIVGQFGGVLLFAIGAYAFAAGSGRQVASGLALAMLALKPHVTAVLVPLAVGEIVVRRRWRAFAAAAGIVVALVAASLALRPTWPLEWIALLTGPAAPGNGANLIGVLATFGVDRVWVLVAIVLAIAAAAGLLAMSPRAPIDVVAVGACASFLVTPYSGSHDHLILAAAWARTLAVAMRSTAAHKAFLLGGLVLTVSLLPWALYAFALRSRPDEALNGFVPLAAFALLGLAYALERRQTSMGRARNMP
jgi:glycosyl transferase family 87